jgi:ribonucleoside-triphosphate reductase
MSDFNDNDVLTIPLSKINNIFDNFAPDNANVPQTTASLNHSLFELVGRELAKLKLPKHILDAHNKGFIYLNDLSYFGSASNSNCFVLDPRVIAANGLILNNIDSTMNNVSKPAKHMHSFTNHLMESTNIGSSIQSGGFAISLFPWVAAPFLKKKDDLKNIIQNMIYRMNQSGVARGGQSNFSSVIFDLAIPEFLKGKNPIVNGDYKGQYTYDDFTDEAELITRTFFEVLAGGDAEKKMFYFPNPVVNIDGGNFDDFPEIFDLCNKYSNVYFASADAADVEYQSVAGCRSSFRSNWTGDPEKDCMSCGNLIYSLINLPFIALDVDKDQDKFYTSLDYYMEVLYEYEMMRYENILREYDGGFMGFYTQLDKLTGRPMYDLENGSLVISVIGMQQCIKILTDGEYIDNLDLAEDILKFMTDKIDVFKKRSGLRFALFGAAAENSTYKLAKKIIKEFGYNNQYVNGDINSPYLTNSVHLGEGEADHVLKKGTLEGRFTKYLTAGNIFHAFLGETHQSPLSMRAVVEKIRDTSKCSFYTITKDYSQCPLCGTTYNGVTEHCTRDGAECTVFSKITGYVRPVKNWNKGKKAEFRDRFRY